MTDWLNSLGYVREAPGKPALITPSKMWTYEELVDKAFTMAARLAAWDVKAGSRVAVLSPNSAQYVFLIHALLELGATLIPLNTRLTLDELKYQVQTARPTLLIDTPETETRGKTLYRDINTRPVDFNGFRSAHFDPIMPETTDESIAAILFTSGTTGQPKGVRLTRSNLWLNALWSNRKLSAETPETDRWLLTLPLYHVGGLSIVYRTFLAGQTLVLYEGGFDPQRVSDALHQHQITHVSLVPTQLYRMLEAGVSFPSSLRIILLGGAAASPDLLKRAFDAGLPVAPTYGMTETASQITTMLPDAARRKPGSVGKPISQTRLRVVAEDNSTLPANQIGEIVIQTSSSDTLMLGYLDQPDITDEDEFHTGDLGDLDDDGDLWIVQRRSDLIISGGENVYPAEVENVLYTHPAIADACVVGLADAEWGQIVAAALIIKPDAHATADEIDAHCQQHLAGYKRPRRIIFVDALPQTASGKVIRREVAAMFA
ncbi:MAG: o-succinylbenzoate--CoA ligase [Chloroflexota bacterium]|nr:o-succinylbenzoate--CoA ligase [Chloroflexota bacterium]